MVLHIRSASESRDPPPPPTTTDKLCVVDDPRVLAALAADGGAQWVLPADAHGFTREGARLPSVRAWLEGARLPDGGTVHVRMATRGSYLHRSGGSSYRFTSRPLVRDFRYRVRRADDGSAAWVFPNGTYGSIEADGVVDDELGYAYLQPTPYAEWHVAVTGDGLDLSGLTRVVMQFAGSVNPWT
jgi:hypothetical protein